MCTSYGWFSHVLVMSGSLRVLSKTVLVLSLKVYYFQHVNLILHYLFLPSLPAQNNNNTQAILALWYAIIFSL